MNDAIKMLFVDNPEIDEAVKEFYEKSPEYLKVKQEFYETAEEIAKIVATTCTPVLSSGLGFMWPAPMISIISLDWGCVKR